MSSFALYLQIGYEHIVNWKAYDHIMFIVALCAAYQLSQWRNILILITAFTLGHSLTLALATFQLILIPRNIIEFLIPFTILITSVYNVRQKPKEIGRKKVGLNYIMALFFGCIHGMAFSGELQMLLGKEENIVSELLAFNIGIELGQILIVLGIFVAAYLVLKIASIKHHSWNLALSSIAGMMSVYLMFENWPWG